jgi:hypothetical protein
VSRRAGPAARKKTPAAAVQRADAGGGEKRASVMVMPGGRWDRKENTRRGWSREWRAAERDGVCPCGSVGVTEQGSRVLGVFAFDADRACSSRSTEWSTSRDQIGREPVAFTCAIRRSPCTSRNSHSRWDRSDSELEIGETESSVSPDLGRAVAWDADPLKAELSRWGLGRTDRLVLSLMGPRSQARNEDICYSLSHETDRLCLNDHEIIGFVKMVM